MLFIISIHENITIFTDTEVHFYIADLVTYSSSVSSLRAEVHLQSDVLPRCPEERKLSWLVVRTPPTPYFPFLSLEVIYSHKEVNSVFLAVVRSHRITAWLRLGGASGHSRVSHHCSQQVWDLSISREWMFQGICNIFLTVLL